MTGRTNDLVAQLIQSHVGSELRTYQGNLAFATHVVQNGWLPAENDPGILQHLQTLRQHLAEIGQSENDSFLLRLGLTVPGTQRGIVPPLTVLDANRGGFSARRQREAEGQILRLRDVLAIGRRFIPSLSDDTQQAVAELADLCQAQSVPDDVDWLNWFGKLSLEQVQQLSEQAIECLESHEEPISEIGTQILQRLACFRHPPLSDAAHYALIDRRVFWPPSLYRDSGDAVAERIILLIQDNGGQPSLNHLLLALAWTRSDAAQQVFREWAERPPSWAGELYVTPEEYLHHAGWCLDGGGLRRNLFSLNCFRLLPTKQEMPTTCIRCRIRVDEPCPSCGGPLGWLFDLSQLGLQYFSGCFAEAPRKVLCCLHCSCYGPVFTTYRADGTASWLSGNERCEFAYDGAPEECLRRIDAPCPPFACAEPFALEDGSTLGGIPMWLQDAEFPRCIECGRLMTFLAQHDNGSLREEGIYYAFFCAPCHVAAVSYQQT